MNYWLFITNPENWEVTKEKNVLGYAERHKKALSQVHIGDKCLVYVKQTVTKNAVSESSISGGYEIISEIYHDDERIFHAYDQMPNESYPLRLTLRRLAQSEQLAAFKPLIPKLSFIKNKKNWGGTLQGNALLKIPEQDYQTLISAPHY